MQHVKNRIISASVFWSQVGVCPCSPGCNSHYHIFSPSLFGRVDKTFARMAITPGPTHCAGGVPLQDPAQCFSQKQMTSMSFVAMLIHVIFQGSAQQRVLVSLHPLATSQVALASSMACTNLRCEVDTG